jgi:hypothetical protein
LTDITGQAERDRQNGTCRTGQQTGQAELDRQDKTARTGVPGKDRQDRAARTLFVYCLFFFFKVSICILMKHLSTVEDGNIIFIGYK